MDTKLALYAKIDETPEIAVHGQVFTKPHVVELILDLAGYNCKLPLSEKTLLDPGCGNGQFIDAAARRLLKSLKSGQSPSNLSSALMGVEKDASLADHCKKRLTATLLEFGLTRPASTRLADSWIVCDDFALLDLERRFDFVVGNPPYVRQEAIPKTLLAQYRSRFPCLYDRADLYVVFFEHGLQLLKEGGSLGFICPDRFISNKYGKPLRDLISKHFCVRSVIDLSTTTPFEPEVCCYPGIFIVSKEKQSSVDFFRMKLANEHECETVSKLSRGVGGVNGSGVLHHNYDGWFADGGQWTIESPEHLLLLNKLERTTVAMGESKSGCKVSIGVATGADSVFIVEQGQVDVEEELLLPLAMTKDIDTGVVEWKGRYLVNPFHPNDSGQLIQFSEFPRAAKYFQSHEKRLRGRNVGKRNPNRWYRTIDRVHAPLTSRPKLLIPDIKANNIVVYEAGNLYPHHNLYYVVSEHLELRALQAVLRSSVAKFFVWMYGLKMRGGYLRFQAQYLRKIGIPNFETLPSKIISELAEIAESDDVGKLDLAVSKAYGLKNSELQLIQQVSSSSK